MTWPWSRLLMDACLYLKQITEGLYQDRERLKKKETGRKGVNKANAIMVKSNGKIGILYDRPSIKIVIYSFNHLRIQGYYRF